MNLTPQQCGCGGKIEQGVGCLAYSGSDDHVQDAQHEDVMRTGGMGFRVHADSFNAMMSMHLQSNGLDFKASEAVLQKTPQGES